MPRRRVLVAVAILMATAVAAAQAARRPEWFHIPRPGAQALVHLAAVAPGEVKVATSGEGNITVLTVETRNSLKTYPMPGMPGITYENIGAGEAWEGLQTKVRLYYEWLQRHVEETPERLVILGDGGDVAFGGCSRDTIAARYEALVNASGGAKVVCGADAVVWPKHTEWRPTGAEVKDAWKYERFLARRLAVLEAFGLDKKSYAAHMTWGSNQYVNSGFIMGPVQALLEVLGCMRSSGWGPDFDDQVALTECMFKMPQSVTIDYPSALVLTLQPFNHTILEGSHGKLTNAVTGRTQCFAHFNAFDPAIRIRWLKRWMAEADGTSHHTQLRAGDVTAEATTPEAERVLNVEGAKKAAAEKPPSEDVTVEVITVETRYDVAEFPVPGIPGMTFTNVGANKTWQGFLTKVRLYREWVHRRAKEAPNQLLLIVDGGDVAFGGCSAEELIQHYRTTVGASQGADVVCGADAAVWPRHTVRHPAGPEVTDTWRYDSFRARRKSVLQAFKLSRDSYSPNLKWGSNEYVNSGFIMGPASGLSRVLDCMHGIHWGSNYDDQLALTECMFSHPDTITIDYSGTLVLNLQAFNQDILRGDRGVIRNEVTNKTQCFIHFNAFQPGQRWRWLNGWVANASKGKPEGNVAVVLK